MTVHQYRFLLGLLSVCLIVSEANSLEVVEQPGPNSFPLVIDGRAAQIVVDPDEPAVVSDVAPDAFADDVQRVTGVLPEVVHQDTVGARSPAVIIGTVGHSDLIDGLVEAGHLDVSDIEGQWETFKVVSVSRKGDGEPDTLVIVGSDRRGTAFGVFEVSRVIGVSPWYWWADVPVDRSSELHLVADGSRSGPPKVKYRGVFLNDEDWGLQPWAAKTFEPETNDIGPKTYAAIFELLLRLKANYIWPAMHPSTRAFNFYPDNKLVADRYAIVMGSSHAEPMLRNNVDEWERDGSGEWDYVTNRDAVLQYWDQRIAENARFENVYSIGMRGIHDSSMTGGGTAADRARRLEQIFSDQRDMLQRHTGQPADRIPQVFVPYKEVLEIYRNGLKVPDDVILGWVDDNHGYIRQLSNAEERHRPGGSGVYYHLSYWGRPHDYLWLDSVPPGLVWEEMTKALGYGADRLWVVNVGDIKPNERGMDWFLRLAWDADRYGPMDVWQGLAEFYRECFGQAYADEITELMAAYYRLNFARKPEHMGWSTVYPTTPVQDSELSHWAHGDEAQRRLLAFDDLEARAEQIAEQLDASHQDAYFQLVLYPVRSAADMNRKLIHAEKSRCLALHGWPAANEHARLAEEAYDRLLRNTEYYNESVAGGKWRGMMSLAPRDLASHQMPPVGRVETSGRPELDVRVEGKVLPAVPDGVDPGSMRDRSPTKLELPVGDARVAGGMVRASVDQRDAIGWPQADADRVQGPDGPVRASFEFMVEQDGRFTLRFEVNHPTDNDDSWHVIIDDEDPITWNNHPTNGEWTWFDVTEISLSKGRHQLVTVAREDGARLRQIVLVPAEPSHPGVPVLTEDVNRLPTLNRYTRRDAFIDLYNEGGGNVSWSAQASEPWVQLSRDSGQFEVHQRIHVAVDFSQATRRDRLAATIEISDAGASYRLVLPVRNPEGELPSGTFLRENDAIAIDAEHFADNSPGAGGSAWRVIDGVGYTGACVGPFPRLLPDGVTLTAGQTAPTLTYPLHLFEGGEATLTLQALPTHEINADHALVCAVAIDNGPPQTVRFAHGNNEHDEIWQRNVLRGAMTGSTTIDLPAGPHTLTVYGIDPSVVLDRLMITFAPIAPAYLGPRETRVLPPASP